VQHELKDPKNELWLSPVSTWEALLLNDRGRIRLRRDLAGWLLGATANLVEAPLTHEIAMVAHQLPLPHRGPADRFLAATAQVLGLTLITADERLVGFGEIAILANR
jgi:PIN domain nuclease of toxin-antitoxin system